jgi:hypothetical protein
VIEGLTMPAEISVTVKNDEKRQTHKHLVYDKFCCDLEDNILKSLVDDACKQFNAEVEDITIKIVMVVK